MTRRYCGDVRLEKRMIRQTVEEHVFEKARHMKTGTCVPTSAITNRQVGSPRRLGVHLSVVFNSPPHVTKFNENASHVHFMPSKSSTGILIKIGIGIGIGLGGDSQDLVALVLFDIYGGTPTIVLLPIFVNNDVPLF